MDDFLNNLTNFDVVFDELDVAITSDEILSAIKCLNLNKANGVDGILNEYLIHCKDVLMPCLVTLFNNIFQSGLYPEIWSRGCIIPVFKKGDVNDPNNYRGITLVSCLGKLFTSILNTRLFNFDNQNSVITDAQFGFRKNLSTIDAIFVLQTLINKTLKHRKRLYCAFIDYKKAFDFVNRNILWYKLIKAGVRGKMFDIIKSLYQNVMCCVKHNGLCSDFFNCNSGLFQGEVLSPILFSMYVNDCEMQFLNDNCKSVEIQAINLFLIMYADDMVLLSETPDDLQNMLDSLANYTKKWDLTVNTSKTKVMIFRNGGRVRENETWVYNGEVLETVNEFNYLGMLMNFNGKFRQTQLKVAEQGRKALFSILNVCKENYFNVETQLSVFDTYVSSVLNYASEIWGFHQAPDVEKIHLKFCKRILGLDKRTCNNFVYHELGRYPLAVIRKVRIMKYWMKLRSSNNCILQACYSDMLNENGTWLMKVKEELFNIGLGDIWEDPFMNPQAAFVLVKTRLFDIFRQDCFSKISSSPKGFLYQHIPKVFDLQVYLKKVTNNKFQKEITRIRTSSHKLNIENGRYQNIERRERKCTLCNLNDVEDEFHFSLICPFYSDLRLLYIKQYYRNRPSVFKFLQLLSTDNVKELNMFGKYLYRAKKRRSAALEV